jgi:hypothetical protein
MNPCERLFRRDPGETVSVADLQELYIDLMKLKDRTDKLAGASIFNAGGGGRPAGAPGVGTPFLNGTNGAVLFNDNNAFGEDAAAFSWDENTDTLSVSAVTVMINRGLKFIAQVDGAGVSAGTLGNAPVAGNPRFWLPVTVNAVDGAIPVW